MVRFAALLPLLVACNAGPLQWSDAETWSAADAWVECEAERVGDGVAIDACAALRDVLTGAAGTTRPARQVSGRSIVVGFDRCMTALRANDTVEPSTCAFAITTGDDIRNPVRSYSLTLRAAAVDVTRETWRVRTQARWTMQGTVTEGSVRRDVLGSAFTSTVLLPVR